MAQNTKTWNDLTGLVQSRLGHDLSDKDLVRVGYLSNSAATMLYDESPYWERFLVLEPRSVERGYVAYTEDGYNVYGAGTNAINGLYTRNGSKNSKPMYTLIENEVPKFELSWSGSDWQLLARAYISSNGAIVTSSEAWVYEDGDVLYDNASADATPPEAGWLTNVGEDLSPIVQELSEIGEYIGHWNGAKWQGGGSAAGTAYPDQNGIRITDGNMSDVVYMAFKKTQGEKYGDGESGTVSAVPSEWFNYMGLQTASAWDGAQDRPTVRVKDIDRAWDQALLKINRQGIYQNIAQRFRTYYGYDVSVR